MPVEAPQIGLVSSGDTEVATVDFTDLLDDDELLTGTPTVTESGSDDLTLSNPVVVNAQVTVLNRTVVAYKSMQFKFSGQQSGSTYTVTVTVTTDNDPARTLERDVKFRCL